MIFIIFIIKLSVKFDTFVTKKTYFLSKFVTFVSIFH